MPPSQYRSGPNVRSRRRDGVALIIVLAFVVIITGVILAFFSRAIANRAISNASANQTKADLLAQGAADDIIGNLQAEIVAGSTTATMLTGTATVYTPSSPALMAPQLAGTNGIANPALAPNLVLRSANGQNFFGSGGTTIPFNAVAVSSTTPSLNGRSVSLARWNAPYYLPLATGSDATPATGSFAPPDWVLVARNGLPVPAANFAATATSATNGTTVIGRYAYAIYNEGNLLDANVAGYPSTTNTNTQSAYKPNLAYADLTQVGLTGTQVDQLVAWRNYASATVPGASYQNPQFTGSSASNYYSFAVSNPSGFLAVSSTGLNPGNSNGLLGAKGQSDRMFGSRQELISFFENGLRISGTALGALQYLTTFTRGLNQPSVYRDPTRPLIQQTGISQTGGGNNADGFEDASQVSNPINPSFLTVRVTGAFTRNDGSTAVIGEPLVKKRFALSRLAWLTYLGPSALRTPASAWAVGAPNPGVTNINYDMWAMVNLYGISPAYLAQGTANNIANYFGLVWQKDGTATQGSFHDGEYKWYYAGHNNLTTTNIHGVTTGGPGQGPPLPGTPGLSNTSGVISRIVDIANLGSKARDPDFFELLKATVAAGSKAKGSMSQPDILTGIAGLPGSVSEPYYYQVFRDTSLDYAIMQLGANIIDQFKVDGYSTRIVFNDGGGGPLSPIEVRGVENLPYMYRFQSGMIKLRLENPVLPGTPTRGDNQAIPPPITDSGVGLIMHVPVIWNPHDANAPMGYPGPSGPSVPASQSGLNFRLIADSVEPNFIAASGSSGYNFFAAEGEALSSPALNSLSPTITAAMVAASKYTTGPNGVGPMIPAGLGTGTGYSYPALTPSNAEMLFQVPGNLLFREPTVLAMAGLPQGSNLQLGAPPPLPSDYTSIQNSAGAFAYQGSGVTAGFRTDPNAVNPLDIPTAPSTTQPYIGICYGIFPIDWIGPMGSGSSVYRAGSYTAALAAGAGPFITYRLQYKDPNTSQDANGAGWVTYDEKYTSLITLFNQPSTGTQAGNLSDQDDIAEGGDWASYVDPRTSRFSAISGRDFENPVQTPGGTGQLQEWSDQINGVEVTDRPDSNSGYAVSTDRTLATGTANTEAELGQLVAGGWNINLVVNAGYFRTGMFSQNTALAIDNGKRFTGDTVSNATETGPMYYTDPDGVARGGMGNYVTGTPPYSTVGLPLANAYGVNGAPIATQAPAYQAQSRPYILHRPFRSVAELGYVFSGTPWKNIDLFTPQSGDASLLDVFTAYETPAGASNPNPLVAGVVNLNTQQAPVLEAILSGAYVDEVQTSTSGTTNTGFPPLTAQQAAALLNPSNGNTLPARTASSAAGQGPLQNVSELAGRWIGPTGAGAAGYSGPSGDLTTLYSAAFGNNSATMQNVDRFREAFIRPLAAVGNTRVWNLMIDVIAQTGRYPQGNTNPNNFVVDGEQRYWVHVAIDRFTGQVLDKQVEIVKD